MSWAEGEEQSELGRGNRAVGELLSRVVPRLVCREVRGGSVAASLAGVATLRLLNYRYLLQNRCRLPPWPKCAAEPTTPPTFRELTVNGVVARHVSASVNVFVPVSVG